MTTITIPLTDEQITDLINGKSVVIAQSAIPKPKSELDLLKEKYESGDYISLWKNEFNSPYGWQIAVGDCSSLLVHSQHKLIHKKHKDVLDAYLADNSIEIEFKTIEVLEHFF